MNIINNVKPFCLDEKSTILDAMKTINKTQERVCFIIDSENRLIRLITDGDIRRAIIDDYNLDSLAIDVHDRKPFVIKEDQDPAEARHYLSRRISVVPIINNNDQLQGFVRFYDAEPFMNIRSRRVLVLGMGYVGLTLAVILADKGFAVYGFDIDKDLIDFLKQKKTPFYEKGMENYLGRYVDNGLLFLSSLQDFTSEIYIITVGTPVDKKTLKPNIDYIRAAIKSIGGILKKNDLIILRSTVPVGLTRKVALPLLEEESGLKVGEDFYLAYCPERTVEGRALEELKKNPQIIGGYDVKSTELASRLFNENTHTVIDVGSLEAAEMCKLIDNTYRDTIFAYANQMAFFCEKVGLNLHELIDKINLFYTRNFIPKPSPGVGGACLSKDPYILIQNFKEYGLDSSLIQEARKINEKAPQAIYERSQKLMSEVGKDLKKAKIFIIGFAFKGRPETSDLRESTTVWFLDELRKNKVKNIYGYDPIVDSAALEELGVLPCSLEEGFKGADAVFIMNNHHSYADMKIFELLDMVNNPVVFFDCWHIFAPSDIRNIPGVIHAGIGVG